MNTVHLRPVRLVSGVLASIVGLWSCASLAAGNVFLSLGATFPRNPDYPANVAHLTALFSVNLGADYPVISGLPLYVATALGYSTSEYLGFLDENCRCYDLYDASAGLRLRPRQAGRFIPYAGVGGLLVDAGVRTKDGTQSSDRSGGYYAEAGGWFPLPKRLGLGAEVRVVRGTHLTLSGLQGDADSTRGSLIVAYRFE
jgi:hypothetical protein